MRYRARLVKGAVRTARSFTDATHCGTVPMPSFAARPSRFFLHTGSTSEGVTGPGTLEIVYWNINQRQFPATIYSWLEGAGLSMGTIYEAPPLPVAVIGTDARADASTATTSRNRFAPDCTSSSKTSRRTHRRRSRTLCSSVARLDGARKKTTCIRGPEVTSAVATSCWHSSITPCAPFSRLLIDGIAPLVVVDGHWWPVRR